MPYRRGLMIPTQWAGPAPNVGRLGRHPVVTVPCPRCGQEAILQNWGSFMCGTGHATRHDEIEFACLKDGCKRTARLTQDTKVNCGRHEIDPGPVFDCYLPSQ